MKKISKIVIAVALLFMMTIIVKVNVDAAKGDKFYNKYNVVDTEFRAVWVSTVDNIDLPKQKGTSEANIQEWKNYYLSILDNVELNNMNAIIFQVRPCNDAFYPSKYNPWSSWLVGYGVDPGWDPLEWMVEVTHERGIEFHAWLNPYRASTSSSSVEVPITVPAGTSKKVADYDNTALQAAKQKYFSALKDSAGTNYLGEAYDNPAFATGDDLTDNVVAGTKGQYVLNPANPETIEHIQNTIQEIVENYDVDAIHFDDYFYPDSVSYVGDGSVEYYKNKAFSIEPLVEEADYEKYTGRSFKTVTASELYDYRRANVNNLISSLNDLLIELNKERTIPCVLGMAPAGPWAPSVEACSLTGNPDRGVEGGMGTTAVECNANYSYTELYADTYKWVKEGWVDYMMPQVYFNDPKYTDTVLWWSNAMKDYPDVKLYVGSSLYKCNADEWNSSMEIGYQIQNNQTKKYRVNGYGMYTYNNFLSGNSAAQMTLIRGYIWKTNALNPTYPKYASMYSSTVESISSVTKLEEIADKQIRIHFTKVSDAKAYALYKIPTSITNFSEGLTAANLVTMNLDDDCYIDITKEDGYNYVLVTYAQDNTPHINNDVVDFSKVEANALPEVTLTSVLPKQVLANTNIDLEFSVTDTNNDPLTYKVYFVYRSDSLVSEGSVVDGKISCTWKNTFGIETPGLYFKVEVSDSKDVVIFETETFDVIEQCEHNFSEATCDTPATCSLCGVTEGNALGHNMSNATCEAPATCSRCGYTEGNVADHNWNGATCVSPKTCSVCGKTEGSALGHIWNGATCVSPKTCTTCGATEGSALGHDMEDATCEAPATCSKCGHTEGDPLDHNWDPATKEKPETCSVCGITRGEPAKGCSCKKSALIGIMSSIATAGLLLLFRRRGR